MEPLNGRLLMLALAGVCMVGTMMPQTARGQEQYGPVRGGETIYKIAQSYRDQSEGLSLHQWAWAIYLANPKAFPADMGSLRSGLRLQIPSAQQVREAWALGQGGSRGDLQKKNRLSALELVFRPVDSGNSQAVLAADTPVDRGQQVEFRGRSQSIAGAELAVPLEPDFAWNLPAPVTTPEKLAIPGQAPLAHASSVEREANDPLQLDVGSESGTPRSFRESELYAETQSGSAVDAPAFLTRLQEREAEFAGDIEFDYLYGVLLLDAGVPHEAIYPLLRAYQQQPGDLGIRLDLGRAYFDSGENETARLIFRELEAADPPPRAAAVIDSYLRATQASAGRYEQRWFAGAGLNYGHDSNANSASGLAEFSGFLLDESAQTTASDFAQLVANVAMVFPVGPRLKWHAGVGAYSRKYDSASEFDTLQWSLNSGLGWKQGDWMASGDLSFGQAFVDGESNHDFAAVNVRWRWFRGARHNLQANLKFGGLRYARAYSVRDVDQVLGSVGAAWRHPWFYGVETGFELAAGADSAVEESSPYGRDLLGGSVNIDLQALPWLRFILSGNYLTSDYTGAFLNQQRTDRQRFADLEVLLTNNRWKGWGLRLGARAIRNDSTVDLYGYDRNELSLGLKWQSE